MDTLHGVVAVSLVERSSLSWRGLYLGSYERGFAS